MAAPSSSTTTGTTTDSNESLSASFYRAQRLVQKQTGRTETEANALLQLLNSIAQRITQASLFSTNEELDDLSTTSMKYLLVDYYLGQVESSFPCGMNQRLDHLTNGVQYYSAFLQRLSDYKAADKKEVEQCKEYFKAFKQKLKAASSSSTSSGPSRPSRPANPNAALTAKKERYKREKELTDQLNAMQQKRKSSFQQNKLKSGTSGTMITSADANDDTVDEEYIDQSSDEDSVRAFYGLLFQSYVLSAVDATKSALDEVDILIHHHSVELKKPKDQQLQHMSEAERLRQVQQDPRASAKPVVYQMTPDSLNQPVPTHMKHLLQNLGQLPPGTSTTVGQTISSSTLQPIRPSTIVSQIDSLIASRSNAREEVFKLTNQPTISIEQWAESEMAAGRLAGPDNTPQPRGPDPRRIRSAYDREVAEEMVEELQRTQIAPGEGDGLGHEDGQAGRVQDELKTMKDREWDNWKDDHQKGVGNSMK